MTHETDDQRLVRFSIRYHGRTVIVENVPASVDPDTGEEFFSPETVERLQAIVWSDDQGDGTSETRIQQFEP